MRFRASTALLFFVLLSGTGADATELDINIDEVSFSCADDLLPTIDILGRGTDFPAFLVEDVRKELKRQDPKAELLSIKCTGEPEITGVFEDVQSEGTTQSALDQLNVAFPVEMIVFTGEVNWMMIVKQGYQVTSLSTNTPSVTQKFEVLDTLAEDGSPLKGHVIKVQRGEK